VVNCPDEFGPTLHLCSPRAREGVPLDDRDVGFNYRSLEDSGMVSYGAGGSP
jgi:hypothetical protein